VFPDQLLLKNRAMVDIDDDMILPVSPLTEKLPPPSNGKHKTLSGFAGGSCYSPGGAVMKIPTRFIRKDEVKRTLSTLILFVAVGLSYRRQDLCYNINSLRREVQ